MDWFETAMKVVVVIGSVSVLSLVMGLARKYLGLRRPGPQDWLREMRRGRDPAAEGELDELRQAVERLNGEVAELQERLDFTERMLAQQRERPALPDR
jgi:hypothetical protein